MSKHRPTKLRPSVPCACGCGEVTAPSVGAGRPRKWIEGHRPSRPVKKLKTCNHMLYPMCGC